MARILILVAMMALLATGATANIPDASLSTIPEAIIVVPNSLLDASSNPIYPDHYDVVIEGAQGPVDGAYVEIEFSEMATGLISWIVPVPAGFDTPITAGPSRVYAKSAGINGVAQFYIAAGGCVAQMNSSIETEPFIAVIRADNITMGEAWVVSPDIVNENGELAEDIEVSVCVNNLSTCGLADASYFTPCAKTACAETCSEFVPPFGDGVQLGDTTLFSPYAKAGTQGVCTGSWQ